MMKYKITVILECEDVPMDEGADNIYIASIVAGTAAEGAKKNLDPGRKSKIVEAFAEYTEHVDAEL